MARPRKPAHQLVLTEHKGRAVAWYAGREWAFGPWDATAGRPSKAASLAFAAQKAEWESAEAAGVVPDPPVASARGGGLMLATLWGMWCEAGHGPSRERGVRKMVFEALFGSGEHPSEFEAVRVDQFGTAELARWQARLCSATRPDGQKRYGAATVEKCVRAVRQCVRWGVQFHAVPQAVYAALLFVDPPSRGQARPPKRRRSVLREHVDLVIPRLYPQARAVVELLWLTCARPGEVCQLRRKDVLTGGRVMPIAGVPLDLDELGVWAAVRAEHKTDHSDYDRILFFGPQSQAVLRPFLGVGTDEHLFRPQGVKAKREYLHPAVVKNLIRVLCKRHQLTHFSPYQLRHSCFKLVQAKYGRAGASAYGGHQVGGATEDYASRDLTLAARIAKEMG